LQPTEAARPPSHWQGINAAFTEPVAGVITRAVESMADTLKRSRMLQEQGLVIFMKGPTVTPRSRRWALNIQRVCMLKDHRYHFQYEP